MIRQIGIWAMVSLERNVKAMTPLAKRVMSSATYGFLNGSVVFSYKKQANFNEEIGDSQLLFLPGGRNGVRNFEGAVFGVEICLDHNIGMLSRQVRSNRPVDIRVTLSDSVRMKPESLWVLQYGGWLIHGSTDASENGVWQKTTAGITTTKSLGIDAIESTNLTNWGMDLNVNDPYELAGIFMTKGMQPRARSWPTVQGPKPFRSTG